MKNIQHYSMECILVKKQLMCSYICAFARQLLLHEWGTLGKDEDTRGESYMEEDKFWGVLMCQVPTKREEAADE